jgi:hypothetical protein
MATAENTGTSDAAELRSPPVPLALDSICTLGLVAASGIALTDPSPLPAGYKGTMLLVAVCVAAILLIARSKLLLRPEGGLLVGLAWGLVITTARSRNIPNLELLKQEPWWGVQVSYVGLVMSAVAVIYLVRSAADGFRNLRANPYALGLIAGLIIIAAAEMLLTQRVRSTEALLLLDTPCAFASLALQYVTTLLLCSSPATDPRLRRILGALAVLALLLKAVFPHSVPEDAAP